MAADAAADADGDAALARRIRRTRASSRPIATCAIQTGTAGWSSRPGVRRRTLIGQPLFEVCPEIVARGFERYYRAALDGEDQRARAAASTAT